MITKGRVWIFDDDINTDLIFPHDALGLAPDAQCTYCMRDNRPGWAEQVRPGDILIAGKNFGTGSSRPGAAILKRLGLSCILSESFNTLFYRNCISYGFAAMRIPAIRNYFHELDVAEVNLAEGYVKNIRTGEILYGNRLSTDMLESIRSGGIEGVLKARGYILTE